MEESRVSVSRSLRYKLLKNPYRAKYHIVAPEGVCTPFDPNGAIYYKGVYHLFYILSENGIPCWGHMSSRDLLHWKHHPVALYADDSCPENGIYSGSAMMTKEGGVALIYHGVDQGNCIAIAKDDMLINFEKLKNNPIIKEPKKGEEGYGIYSSWDPHGWLEDGEYRAIFGGGQPAYFTSDDLQHWEYQGPFIEKDERLNEKYEDYSCPDFFPLGDKHVFMFISHNRGVQYYTGQYKDGKFTPEKHERMTLPGSQFFANESFADDKGRRILWGWVLEARTTDASYEEEFLGTMSLPKELVLGEDGLVNVKPIEELKQLRYDEVVLEQQLLEGEKKIPEITGRQLELELEFRPGAAKKAGIKVLCSRDCAEETLIYYDFEREQVVIDTSNSSRRDDLFSPVYVIKAVTEQKDVEQVRKEIADKMERDNWNLDCDLVNGAECFIQRLPMKLSKDNSVKLRVFVDASIIEVFVNDRKCMTQRAYPKYEQSNLVKLFTEGGNAILSSFAAWKMDTTNAW